MPIRLDAKAADFAPRFAAFLAAKREAAADVEAAARDIIADVAARGDRALTELSKRFDRRDLDSLGWRVKPAEISAAAKACDRQALDALSFARDRLKAYHRRQKPSD